MAESTEEVLDKALLSVKNDKSSNMECAVCLQACIHPAELPCGHIFCYLCIKGIVNQGRRCAMCRRDIPVDYLDKPILLSPVDAEVSSQGFEDGHLWFYEGHNGWWQYDERTSLELESAYQKGERCCELLIAGFLYVADFDEMLQYRRNDPSRRRRIKRDLATTNKKGVAGLKTMKFNNSVSSNSTAAASNELTVTQSISNAPMTTNSSPVRFHIPVISNEVTEPVSNCQRSRERILRGLSHSACSSTPPMESSSHADTSDAYSRNFNFDNITQETLDLTIEQIESLSLELLNDYEVLFRDVNYGQSQDSLHQNRSGRVVENYLTRYLNRNNPHAEPLENQSETAHRAVSNLSESSDENSDSELIATPQETLTTNETESAMPLDADTPPQPPPRGTTRRRNFLRNSLNLAHEIFYT